MTPKERAEKALRFPRPCKCFDKDTTAPLPQCKNGLCADAVDNIALAITEAVKAERDACADVAHHHGYASDGEIAWDERNGIRKAILARAE